MITLTNERYPFDSQALGELVTTNITEIQRTSRQRLPIFEELSPSALTVHTWRLASKKTNPDTQTGSATKPNRVQKEIAMLLQKRGGIRG